MSPNADLHARRRSSAHHTPASGPHPSMAPPPFSQQTGSVEPASGEVREGTGGRATARRPIWLAPSLAAVIVVTTLAVPRLLSWPIAGSNPLLVLPALLLPTLGVFLTTRRCGGPVGWLLLVGGTAEFVSGALFPDAHQVAPHDASAAWMGVISGFCGTQALVALAAVVPLFPNGRLPGPRWRPLMAAAAAASALFAVMMAIPWNYGGPCHQGTCDRTGHPLTNPIGVGALRPLGALFTVAMLLVAVVVAGGLAAMAVRWRRGAPGERTQLAWVLWAVGVSAAFTAAGHVILAFSYRSWLDNILVVPWGLLVPLAIAIAVSRFRLYDIDVVVSRSLTYGTLILALAAIYAATVAAAENLVAGALPSLAAAVLVAVCLAPLRDRLQRSANRLVYGQRDEPYQALASLAARLEGQIPPAEVVDAVVEGVASALRLPYVALRVPAPGRRHWWPPGAKRATKSSKSN